MKAFRLVLPLALLLALLCACSSSGGTWQEQYDLGQRYLQEEDYEQALLAFEAAIQIDPRRPEAYVGMAQAYVALGDPDSAAGILVQGQQAAGESQILTDAWAELGLTPPADGSGSSSDAQGDSSSTSEGASFEGMTPEEITDILPSLTQPEAVRTEREDRENGSYEIYEYDSDNYIIRITSYTQNGVENNRQEYFHDQERNTLLVNYFSPDGDTYPAGLQYRIRAPRLALDYRDLSGWRNAVDISITTYHYSDTQATMTQQDTTEEYTCISTVVYTMSSSENEIELWAHATDAANSSHEYLVIREYDPSDPAGTFSAFHGDGTPYPELDLSQYTS